MSSKLPFASVEWLVTENCNFSCNYCDLYNNRIRANRDMDKTYEFLKGIARKQVIYDFQFFVFGGEPFLHPEISSILNIMNELNIDYVMQTNLSKKAMQRIESIVIQGIDINLINVSVHFSQQDIDTYIDTITRLLSLNIPINNIDIMYDGVYTIKLYRDLVAALPNNLNIFLVPVSDFLVTGFADILREYNTAATNSDYSDIKFEQLLMTHPVTGEEVERSIIWQEFVDNVWSPKGKPCILKDKFLMYDSNFNTFNCCFHDTIEQPYICPYDSCFLS